MRGLNLHFFKVNYLLCLSREFRKKRYMVRFERHYMTTFLFYMQAHTDDKTVVRHGQVNCTSVTYIRQFNQSSTRESYC